MIAAFLTHLKKERDVSPNTITAYRRDLEGFETFVRVHLGAGDAELEWGRVDRLVMRAWLAHLHRGGLSPRSSARALSAVRSFFRFLHREDVVDANPARSVGSPRLARHLPGHLDRARHSGAAGLVAGRLSSHGVARGADLRRAVRMAHHRCASSTGNARRRMGAERRTARPRSAGDSEPVRADAAPVRPCAWLQDGWARAGVERVFCGAESGVGAPARRRTPPPPGGAPRP